MKATLNYYPDLTPLASGLEVGSGFDMISAYSNIRNCKKCITSRLLTVIDGGRSFLKRCLANGARFAFSGSELGLIGSDGAHQAINNARCFLLHELAWLTNFWLKGNKINR